MKLPTSDFLWLASRRGVVDEDTMRRICYVVLRDQLPPLQTCFSDDFYKNASVKTVQFFDRLAMTSKLVATSITSIIDTANRYDDGHASSVELVSILNLYMPIYGQLTKEMLGKDDEWLAMLSEERPPNEIYTKVITVLFTAYTFWFGRIIGDASLDYIAAITRQWAVPNFDE
jgi:hypothetical protein